MPTSPEVQAAKDRVATLRQQIAEEEANRRAAVRSGDDAVALARLAAEEAALQQELDNLRSTDAVAPVTFAEGTPVSESEYVTVAEPALPTTTEVASDGGPIDPEGN